MKKCPKCGAIMSADVNFCTECGEDLREIVITEDEKVNNQEASAKKQPVQQTQKVTNNSAQHASNYWNWLVSSWKAPMKVMDHEKWFGLVTLIGEIIITVLGFWRMIKSGVDTATSATGSAVSSLLGSEATRNISTFANQQIGTVIVNLFLSLLIGTIVMIALSILGYKFVYNQKIDFMEYTTRLAQYSNYNVILALLALLFALMGVNQLLIFFSIVMILVFTVATLVPVLADGEGQKDKVIGGLVVIAGLLIAFIIFSFFMKSTIQSIITSFSSFGSNS